MQQTFEGFRLSLQQTRCWQLLKQNQLAPAFCRIGIDGALNSRRLRQALETILKRNEIYRTIFYRPSNITTPVQVIQDTPHYVWRYGDLSNCSPQKQSRAIDTLLQEIELASVEGEPLLDCLLLTLGKHEHTLLIHFHPLHVDAQTMYLFTRDLAHWYMQYPFSHPMSDVEEIVQYTQFAEWQNSLSAGEQDSDDLAYWRRQNSIDAPLVTLPGEKKLLPGYHFAPTSAMTTLPSQLYARLTPWLEEQDLSWSIFLLACWQVLLWRLTEQNVLPLGLTVDGRVDADLVEIAGPIAQVIPMLCKLHADLRFTELLDQVRQNYEELLQHLYAFPWQDFAATHAEDTLRYPIGFEFSAYPAPEATTENSVFTLQRHASHQEPFNVKLVATHINTEMRLGFYYQANILSEQNIRHLVERFVTLVEHACQKPDQTIEELTILGPQERHLLLSAFNQTAAPYPADYCMHQLFEQQVGRTPDSIAVEYADIYITYERLNQHSNQLARYLQSLGVGPEATVGIYMERSPEIIISILGILKAGAAYLPCDLAYPQERLAFVTADAQLSLTLTKHYLQEKLPQQVHALCLDTAWHDITQQQQLPVNTVGPDNLAYVLYTSGSTGKPKGIMIPHQGLVHYVNWASQYYEAAKGIGTPLHSPLAFDLTVTSLFPTLIAGRCVVLVPEEPGIEALGRVLRTHSGFSLLKITPAHLIALNNYLTADELACATHGLIIGGEMLRADSLSFWRQHAPATRIINEYGPTETVVGCCIYEVSIDSPETGNVPIGRPITNTQIYLLDAKLQPVPAGMAGELYLGGTCLGRGYVHRPDLTAERFIPHPFSTLPGARLYKTGDLARYNSEAAVLEFLGRTDNQVKLRGFRIETGEVEAVIGQYSGVQDCVVLLHEDEQRGAELIAYVVPLIHPGPSEKELRAFLQDQLPAYMLPATFTTVSAIPLTVNGKLDQKALLASTSEQKASRERVSPRTPVEEIVLRLWEELLQVDLGIYDNFFASGGHSLLAAQFFARLRSIFQIELPLRSLFDAPNVAEMAALIEQRMLQEHRETQHTLQRISREQLLPVSFAQQRLWFLEQLEPGNTAYLISNALRIQGVLNKGYLEYSLHEIIRRHEITRTTFENNAGTPIQVIHPAGVFHLPIIDLQGLEEEQRSRAAQALVRQEERLPCDLSRGPLLRLFLLQISEHDAVLLVTFHHIICDAWSYAVFLQELTTLYQAAVKQQPALLQPLHIQYADFAFWQRNRLQGDVLKSLLNYWQRQLSGYTALDLSTDYPRPPLQTFNGQLTSRFLPVSLQQSLQAMSNREGVTFFMLLLAAFQVLLARYTGQDDIIVGTPIAYRTHTEIEKIIGIFINTLVMRTNLSGNPDFKEVLRRVREVALGAYTHHEAPFEQLVELLQPARDLSRSPLFQVLFVLQTEREMSVPTTQDITIQAVNQAQTTAKFDLTLFVTSSARGLYCTVEYNTDLFVEETITRLLIHWQTLLQTVVDYPDKPIHSFSLAAPEELKLFQEWNEKHRDSSQITCIHDLFIRQAQQTPDAVALVDENHALSYDYLECISNRLAQYLCERGIRQDEVVGVCLERSLTMIVAVLGILKAGAAYLPLDPYYPARRLTYMLHNSHASFVLTQHKLVHLLDTAAVQVIPVDALHSLLKPYAPAQPHRVSDPLQLAYVIYTSGSTGTPKGVTMSHQALANLFQWQRQHSLARAGGRTLQFSSLSFDVACQEMFTTWDSGGALYIMAEDMRKDPGASLEFIHQHGIQRIFLPFIALQQLAQAYEHTEMGTLFLEEVITAGEQLQSTQQVREFFAGQPGITFWNQYGPSESHVATAFELPLLPETWAPLPSIGTPVANVQIYLLNEQFQPVPMGARGELYIGGICLARGYLFAPDATAANFRPDPWSPVPGSRLYKTGDLARYNSDGTLQFLGRQDHQVKIRGYRIEPGEIETLLSQHPAISENVVTVQQSQLGDKKLVAYFVATHGSSKIIQELRAYLLERVPAYMVPSVFIQLEQLPLTPSGKIDRRALPLMQSDGELHNITRPRDALEAQLEIIWREVLEIGRVGVTHNFFELGGHSLLAVKLMARIKQTLGYELPLASLFRSPSIEEQAIIIRQGTAASTSAEALIAIQPRGTQLPFFCIHPAGGTVFRYYLLSHFMGTDCPFYGLQSPDLDGQGTTLLSIEDLAAYYIQALQTIQPQGPYLLGGWSMGGVIAFEIARQLQQRGQEVALLVLIDSVVEHLPGEPVQAGVQIDLSDEAIAKEMLNYYGLSSVDTDVHETSVSPTLHAALEQFKLHDILPQDTRLEQARRLMRIGVANLYAFQNYYPTCLAQQLVLFRAQEGIGQEGEGEMPFGRTRSRGWEALTTCAVEIRNIPGNHSSILDDPNVRTLALLLREYIQTASKRKKEY